MVIVTASLVLGAVLLQPPATAPQTPPPPAPRTAVQLAGQYYKDGQIDRALEILETAAANEGVDPAVPHILGTLYWDLARKITDPRQDDQKLRYVLLGIAAEDRALAIRPDMLEALTYKSLLLRTQANLSASPLEQKALIEQADKLRSQATALQGAALMGATVITGKLGSVPASQAELFSEPFDATVLRLKPLRVTGNVKAPAKIKDVRPVYPADARAALVQGVVIIEALVDSAGKVANARVLRSVPMLDLAALSAVKEWEFTPIMLNGAPVPAVMTVTVNFTLQ